MTYDNPFPGMNPYLEHRDIWPDFHDDLAAQLRGVLGPQLPDRYRIALQRRVEVAEPFGDPPGHFEFCDYVHNRLGMNIPIFPGILPILSGRQIQRFSQLCGASIPKSMSTRLRVLGENDAAVAEYGIDYASQQCRELLDEGAPGIHFYCLNKARSTVQVVKNLNLRTSSAAPKKQADSI